MKSIPRPRELNQGENDLEIRTKCGQHIVKDSARKMLVQLLAVAGFSGSRFKWTSVTTCSKFDHARVVRVGNPKGVHGVEVTICTRAHEGYIGTLSCMGSEVKVLHERLRAVTGVGGLFDPNVSEVPESNPRLSFQVLEGGLNSQTNNKSLQKIHEETREKSVAEHLGEIIGDVSLLTMVISHLADEFSTKEVHVQLMAFEVFKYLGISVPLDEQIIQFEPLKEELVRVKWMHEESGERDALCITPLGMSTAHGSSGRFESEASSSPSAVQHPSTPVSQTGDDILERIKELRCRNVEYKQAQAEIEGLKTEQERLEEATSQDRMEKERLTKLIQAISTRIVSRQEEVIRLNEKVRALDGIINDPENVRAEERLKEYQRALS